MTNKFTCCIGISIATLAYPSTFQVYSSGTLPTPRTNRSIGKGGNTQGFCSRFRTQVRGAVHTDAQLFLHLWGSDSPGILLGSSREAVRGS